MYDVNFLFYIAIQPNLELETRYKQYIGYFLLGIPHLAITVKALSLLSSNWEIEKSFKPISVEKKT